MEIRYEDGDKVCYFNKFEGMSVCPHHDNNPNEEQIHDEEEYILEPEYYNGEKGLEDYLTENYKGEFCTVHYYRYLVYGENYYEAGETFTEQYYVCEDGDVLRWR